MLILFPIALSTIYGYRGVAALKCHQCNGWDGRYPSEDLKPTPSTCDNNNNQCETAQFCVKIIDQMNPGVSYVTYKSDCYYTTTIQVNPQNLSTIQSRFCYPFQDGSAPVKKWWYCFCNDRDYCNPAAGYSFSAVTLLMAFAVAGLVQW